MWGVGDVVRAVVYLLLEVTSKVIMLKAISPVFCFRVAHLMHSTHSNPIALLHSQGALHAMPEPALITSGLVNVN